MKPFSPSGRVLCFRNCHLTHLITLVIMTEIDAVFAQPKTAHKDEIHLLENLLFIFSQSGTSAIV